MQIVRKGYYTITGPDGALLLKPDGATRQVTSRDECYERITEDGRAGKFTINTPNYEVDIDSSVADNPHDPPHEPPPEDSDVSVIITTPPSGAEAPTYTPMLTNNFESSVPFGVQTTDQAHGGSNSCAVDFVPASVFFGGWENLPSDISSGDTVWYRLMLYFPSTLSTSSAAANPPGDYSGWGKFMMLSPINHSTPRMYLQIPAPNAVEFGDPGYIGTGLRVDSDGLGFGNLTYGELPRDQWFSLQYAWQLGASGFIRVWVDETFVGEVSGNSGSTVIRTWGMGDYWNGKYFAREEDGATVRFYMDNLVITTETPNTTDSGGRPFVHPTHFIT